LSGSSPVFKRKSFVIRKAFSWLEFVLLTAVRRDAKCSWLLLEKYLVREDAFKLSGYSTRRDGLKY